MDRIEQVRRVKKLEAESATAMAAGRLDYGVSLLEKALDLAMQAREPPPHPNALVHGRFVFTENERFSARIAEIRVKKLEAESATAMAAGRADHGVTLLEKALDLAMQARTPSHSNTLLLPIFPN